MVIMMMTYASAADLERKRELVRYADVVIDVITEGAGPLVVLLPSRGRDSEDYDEVAHGIAQYGFRVVRPQPRGIAKSTGPMRGITLHDFGNDIAAVIRHYGGPAVIVGHAFGNWVARTTATDHPELVRGVVIAAAAAKTYPPDLSVAVTRAATCRCRARSA
jgi:pimeloyl-ACP methyl ester carboxylesterase